MTFQTSVSSLFEAKRLLFALLLFFGLEMHDLGSRTFGELVKLLLSDMFHVDFDVAPAHAYDSEAGLLFTLFHFAPLAHENFGCHGHPPFLSEGWWSDKKLKPPFSVIPTKAGIHEIQGLLDPGFRRGDGFEDLLRNHQG
jgi:hypothetical protein